MDDTFLFVMVIIGAIIFAIYLFKTTREGRKGGSDQRNSSDGSDLSDFGSEHHGTSYVYGENFKEVEEVIVNVFPKLPPVAKFLMIEIIIFILLVIGFVALLLSLFNH